MGLAGRLVVSLRPKQWVKNAFVLAPLLFSGRAGEGAAVAAALAATACFCAAASGVYLVNDVVDRDADRAHPTKRMRPIAAGEVGVGTALGTAAALIVAAVVAGALVDIVLGAILAGYVAMSVLYSVALKHLVIIDVMVIAAGFVLRVLAGAAAVDVEPSIWLIICMGFLALMLAFGKRRGESLELAAGSADHRAVLVHYSAAFTSGMVLLTAGLALAAYAAYTTTGRAADNHMAATLPFVIYGVFRYLWLVFHHQQGARPTEIAWSDRGIVASVALWALTAGLLII